MHVPHAGRLAGCQQGPAGVRPQGGGAHARLHGATLASTATSQVGTGVVAVAAVAPQTLVSSTSGTSQLGLGRCKSSL